MPDKRHYNIYAKRLSREPNNGYWAGQSVCDWRCLPLGSCE